MCTMSVVSALNNIYAHREPERQWIRAVGLIKDMSEVEIAMSWKAFSAQINSHNVAEAVIVHSQYKSIFDGVVKDAMQLRQLPEEPVMSNMPPSTSNPNEIKSILEKYHKNLVREIGRSARLFARYGYSEDSYPEINEYDGTQPGNPSGKGGDIDTKDKPQTNSAENVGESKKDGSTHHGLAKRIDDMETKLNRIIESGAKLDAIEETLKNINTVATSTTGILEKVEDVLNKDIKMIQIKLTKQEYDRAMEDSRLDTLLTKCGELSDHIKTLDTSISTNKVDMIRECDGKFLALNQKIDSNLSALTAEIKDQCGLLSTQLTDLDEKLDSRDAALTKAVNTCTESVASVNATMEKIPDMVAEEVGKSVDKIIEGMESTNKSLGEIFEYISNDINQLESFHEDLQTILRNTKQQISGDAAKAIEQIKEENSDPGSIVEAFARVVAGNIEQELTPLLDMTDYTQSDEAGEPEENSIDQLQTIHESLLALSNSTKDQISIDEAIAIKDFSTSDDETNAEEIIHKFAASIRSNISEGLESILEQIEPEENNTRKIQSTGNDETSNTRTDTDQNSKSIADGSDGYNTESKTLENNPVQRSTAQNKGRRAVPRSRRLPSQLQHSPFTQNPRPAAVQPTASGPSSPWRP